MGLPIHRAKQTTRTTCPCYVASSTPACLMATMFQISVSTVDGLPKKRAALERIPIETGEAIVS